MSEFIKGIELCESFFSEVAEPIIRSNFPGLNYSAGLIGYGSDVLGYDDATSTDHMWGPRFYLFLSKEDIWRRPSIEEVLSEQLPYTYKGFSVNFGSPDQADNGVRQAVFLTEGKVSPLIFIEVFEEFMTAYLGKAFPASFDYTDWLSFSEHRLLALTSGKLFVDTLGIENIRRDLRFYPQEIKLYMLASNWSIIAEEQAFIKRCGAYGDEIGSRIISARIADRLMRLCFLYEERYAPYSKWFGTAFQTLNIDREIAAKIRKALSEDDLLLREDYIVHAQKLVADLHNSKGITAMLDSSIEAYFDRDIKVIHADRYAAEIAKKLNGTPLESLPLISTFSQVGNLNAISDHVGSIDRIKSFYR